VNFEKMLFFGVPKDLSILLTNATLYEMYEIMKPKHVKKFMKSKESGTQNS
jgi:hypothetical protein